MKFIRKYKTDYVKAKPGTYIKHWEKWHPDKFRIVYVIEMVEKHLNCKIIAGNLDTIGTTQWMCLDNETWTWKYLKDMDEVFVELL